LQFTYADNCLSWSSKGSYGSTQPLANITIVGMAASPNAHRHKRTVLTGPPQQVTCSYGGKNQSTSNVELSYKDGVLKVSGTESITSGGAFDQDLKIGFKW
jgi:alpha-glucosidase